MTRILLASTRQGREYARAGKYYIGKGTRAGRRTTRRSGARGRTAIASEARHGLPGASEGMEAVTLAFVSLWCMYSSAESLAPRVLQAWTAPASVPAPTTHCSIDRLQ
jgi:hypothetical protein